ncbi:hypothetical protein ANO11243_052320 [Dothideomycetidae sp. 11243]|nr:hypothetical protein ANO11243_052320 [fungal sp. No.11243]
MLHTKPTQEGDIPLVIPTIQKPCFTHYKIFGDISRNTPRVCVHGGPGAGHNYLLTFTELWGRNGIPVVLYDQIGCGLSTHLPETARDHSLWQVSLFVTELNNVLDYLNLRGGFYLLGHSFGGMIAPEFATTRPQGLRNLILASGAPSGKLCRESLREVIDLMPPDMREAIVETRRTGDFEAPEYMKAMIYFNRWFLCRTEITPPERLASVKNKIEDPTQGNAILGPSPFYEGGSIDDWDCTPRLHQMNVPTLVYNAEYDTSARYASPQPFSERIPYVLRVKFSDAGHMAHLESEELTEKVLQVVGKFLSEEQ